MTPIFSAEDVEAVQSWIGAQASTRSQRAWLTKDDIAVLLEAALPEPLKRLIEAVDAWNAVAANLWLDADCKAFGPARETMDAALDAFIAHRAKEAG